MRTPLVGAVYAEIGRGSGLGALGRKGCTEWTKQETEEGVHWKLLLATLQGEKLFVFIGDFGHGDYALAANEMAAGPAETGGGVESVTADDTFDAGESYVW